MDTRMVGTFQLETLPSARCLCEASSCAWGAAEERFASSAIKLRADVIAICHLASQMECIRCKTYDRPK